MWAFTSEVSQTCIVRLIYRQTICIGTTYIYSGILQTVSPFISEQTVVLVFIWEEGSNIETAVSVYQTLSKPTFISVLPQTSTDGANGNVGPGGYQYRNKLSPAICCMWYHNSHIPLGLDLQSYSEIQRQLTKTRWSEKNLTIMITVLVKWYGILLCSVVNSTALTADSRTDEWNNIRPFANIVNLSSW